MHRTHSLKTTQPPPIRYPEPHVSSILTCVITALIAPGPQTEARERSEGGSGMLLCPASCMGVWQNSWRFGGRRCRFTGAVSLLSFKATGQGLVFNRGWAVKKGPSQESTRGICAGDMPYSRPTILRARNLFSPAKVAEAAPGLL